MSSNRALFLKHLGQTSTAPLAIEVEKAEGIFFHTPEGKRFFDLISGISVSNIGHGNERVKKAIKEQVDRHLHLMVYGELIQSPQNELAALLSKTLPETLNNYYLVNSGSEATEGAIKAAKKFTGRSEIIAFHNSYHGSTNGALSLLGDESFKSNFRPLLPDIRFIRYNELEDLDHISEKTAAVFFEPIQAEAGILIPDNEYVKALRQKCTDSGTLLVFDEIQTGMGRTGKMFAFEHFDCVPDLLLLAKAFGGGMPLGAFIGSKEMMSCLTENPVLGHITTFGGHPVSCAAAVANLSFLLEENVVDTVEEKGALFESLLDHPAILSKTRKGLMMSCRVSSPEQNHAIIDQALEDGLFIDWFLFADDRFRIAPPLIISKDEIREAAELLNTSISKVVG